MINICLTVNKANVYDEVAKTTSYEGAKIKDDNNAYNRIFTTDEDRTMLERFWNEACNISTETFKQFITKVSNLSTSHGVELDNNYDVEMEVSSSYDINLTSSIQASLFSFFVATIVGKWNNFVNKDTVKNYENDADVALMDIQSKLYYRKKPKRIQIV